MSSRFIETVILVEPGDRAARAVTLTQRGVHEILERCHMDPRDPTIVGVRTWRHTHDERDLTGQVRVFREVVAAPALEPAERPQFDERILTSPLPLTDRES